LEFPNGQTVLVTRLCEYQYATVLQLPAGPRVETTVVQPAQDIIPTPSI
jgi:hypothetical protein